MKKVILSLSLMLFALSALAANEITIQNMVIGSGEQVQTGSVQAIETSPGSGLYHAPNYLPGYPTSATLWPAVVEVQCRKVSEKIVCDGFNWTPAFGRGEYVYFKPRMIVDTPPVIIVQAPPAAPAPAPMKISVYFDLDKSFVKSEYDQQLQDMANYLKANPTLSVEVEGNTDQRHNEQYNVALGNRRAEAVKAKLVALGIGEYRMSTVSYGKYRLRLFCLFEKCYKENRRVDVFTK